MRVVVAYHTPVLYCVSRVDAMPRAKRPAIGTGTNSYHSDFVKEDKGKLLVFENK